MTGSENQCTYICKCSRNVNYGEAEKIIFSCQGAALEVLMSSVCPSVIKLKLKVVCMKVPEAYSRFLMVTEGCLRFLKVP